MTEGRQSPRRQRAPQTEKLGRNIGSKHRPAHGEQEVDFVRPPPIPDPEVQRLRAALGVEVLHIPLIRSGKNPERFQTTAEGLGTPRAGLARNGDEEAERQHRAQSALQPSQFLREVRPRPDRLQGRWKEPMTSWRKRANRGVTSEEDTL